MFLNLEKNIYRVTATLLLNVAFLHLITSLLLFENNPQGFKRSTETTLLASTFIENSPGKIENNLKKLDRTSDNITSESKSLSNEKFIYSEEVERNLQIRLLYVIKITNEINILQLISNQIGQRSPPSIQS
ncbi:MAG TPA: hypothetical protein DHV28_16535 [Ignavibacteriales bacterium]|nr:hypothetical protein [Ignavibacteriales bacterium]